ncbi:MAG: hypothetical protein COA79_05750 [Planctomycetota bacterium]|nr:MAG: hypothetical protein COA79_05750 [Planctomycetota bacterium]
MEFFRVIKLVFKFTKEIWRLYKKRFIVMELSVILAIFVGNLGIALLIPAFKFLEPLSADEKSPFLIDLMIRVFDFFNISPSFENVLVIILFLLIFSFMAKIFEGYLRARIVVNIQLSFQKNLLKNALDASYLKFQEFKTSEYQNTIIQECHRAGRAFYLLCTFYSGIVMTVMCLVFAVLISFESFLIVILSGFIIAPLTNIFINRSNIASKRIISNNENIAQVTSDILDGMKYIKSVRSTNEMFEYAQEPISGGKKLRVFLEKNLVNISTIPMSFSGVLLIVLLYLGVYQFQIPILELGVFIVLVQKAYSAYSGMKSKQGGLVISIPSYFKAFDMIESLKEDKIDFDEGDELSLQKSIVIDRLSYKVSDTTILSDISITINKGDSIAIVGFSGSGKTTLMDIMLGLYPASNGDVLYDGTSISKISHQSLSENLSFMSQTPFFYPASLRNNITLGKDKHSDEEIIDVLKMVKLDSLLESLNFDLDAMVGGNYRALSGGEIQRVALARELIKQSSILFLDEATSALDNETELHIKNVLEKLKGEKTIVLIAHRLSSIKNADCIYVMEKGQLVEQGKFDELIKKEGAFSKLYSTENINS